MTGSLNSWGAGTSAGATGGARVQSPGSGLEAHQLVLGRDGGWWGSGQFLATTHRSGPRRPHMLHQGTLDLPWHDREAVRAFFEGVPESPDAERSHRKVRAEVLEQEDTKGSPRIGFPGLATT